MLKNGFPRVLPHNQATTVISRTPWVCETPLSPHTQKSSSSHSEESSPCSRETSRDSGIFDDLVSLQFKDTSNPQGRHFVPQTSVPDNYFDYQDTDEEVNVSSDCDSDRFHHASLSSWESLDSDIDTTSSASSLSVDSSGEDQKEDTYLDEYQAETSADSDDQEETTAVDTSSDEDTDIDEFYNSSDTEVSDSSSVEERNSSPSFGYHSLLNDLTPNGEGQGLSDTDLSKSLDDEFDKTSLHRFESRSTLPVQSDLLNFNFIHSEAVSFTDCSSDSDSDKSDTEEDVTDGQLDEEEDNSSLASSVTLSFSYSSSEEDFEEHSSEDQIDSESEEESPSDIETKMAETEVKMHDARLSNGREELAFLNARRMKQMKQLAKTKKEILGALGSDSPNLRANYKDNKSYSKENFKNNLRSNNNNNNNYKHVFSNQISERFDQSKPEKPRSLPLRNMIQGGNDAPSAFRSMPHPQLQRNSSGSSESPIVDAYEKECRDASEKEVKEGKKKREEREGGKNMPSKGECRDPSENKVEGKKKREEWEGGKNIPSKGLNKEGIKHRVEESEDDSDLKAFETVMKEAIRKKELLKEAGTEPVVTFDLDELQMRHRPSPQQRRRERNALRRALPHQGYNTKENNNKEVSPDAGEFDVYNMETALPKIDWEAIEAHLEATKEEERRRRTDREEIRRKLAMGTEDDAFNDRNLKKPSLQSRLQSGKNLQICFMNETASDCESQCSDTESTQDRIDDTEGIINSKVPVTESELQSIDFVTQQARLQAEARLALAQAKEMARMQMEIEKQNQNKSPITEIVRDSFNKIGFPFPASKRRMSRQILTDMNVAQLQVIVNDLHTQIESLNEDLVRMLLTRDDLHMEQDSMLVDIEDLTKHLGAKQRADTISTSKGVKNIKSNNKDPSKTELNSIPSKALKIKTLVKK